ncbi:unnamed protein product [Cochlearia groenlandica]
MGSSSVFLSLTEIFPQIDARILKAVAIEHPKDADEAAAVVLSEIVPSLPTNSSVNFIRPRNKSHVTSSACKAGGDCKDVSRRSRFLAASGSKSRASSSTSSETVPLVFGRGHVTCGPSTKLVFNRNELTNFPLNVEDEEVKYLKKDPGKEHENYDFFGTGFDVPSKAQTGLHEAEDDLGSVVSSVHQDNINTTNEFWRDLYIQMTSNQAESSTSRNSENAVQKLVDLTPGNNITNKQQGFEVETGNTNVVDETSKGSLASENGDTDSGGAFISSTHGCSVDNLEEIIEDAKSNKKTLFTVMETVMKLIKEVELQEKDAAKSEEEAATGGLDTLEKVQELKKMLEHAKEGNNMHAGEVFGEKSILAAEAKELENRLLNLTEERNKSLSALDEMRETLEIRLAAALEMKWAADKEKKEKEDDALKALAEQEAIMEKVVQESKLLQQEADENSKLREFLMDRGQIVDSLQGEISVIYQDVKLLKVKLTKSVSSSQTSSCGSSTRSFVHENPCERLNGVLETSNNTKMIPEAAATSMNKEKGDFRELTEEDGWDMFDKEIEL